MSLIFLLLLAAFQASMVDYLYNNPTYYQLDSLTWETEAFRAMELGELVCGEDELDLDALTALMVENSYDLRNIDSLSCDSRRLKAAKPAEYEKLKDAYEMIFGDLEYFPIPINRQPARRTSPMKTAGETGEPTEETGDMRAAT